MNRSSGRREKSFNSSIRFWVTIKSRKRYAVHNVRLVRVYSAMLANTLWIVESKALTERMYMQGFMCAPLVLRGKRLASAGMLQG